MATVAVTDHGEISAVETYDQDITAEISTVEIERALAEAIAARQAIEKLAGKPAASPVRQMRNHHAQAVATLNNEVAHRGGEPTTTSGSWGTFAGAVTGAAKLLGPETVLTALKKGEEHGVEEYEEAIAKDGVSESCKQWCEPSSWSSAASTRRS